MNKEPKSAFLKDFIIIIVVFFFFIVLISTSAFFVYKKFIQKTEKEASTEKVSTPKIITKKIVTRKDNIKKGKEINNILSPDISPDLKESKTEEKIESAETTSPKIPPTPQPAEIEVKKEKISAAIKDVDSQDTKEIAEEITDEDDTVKAPVRRHTQKKTINEVSEGQMTKDEFIDVVTKESPAQKEQIEEEVTIETIEMIDIVHLKNGHQIEGNITEKNDIFLILDNEGVSVEIKNNEIDNIETLPKEELEQRHLKSQQIVTPEFMSGQEVVIITYDDKIIQGSIIKIDSKEINLLLDEGSFIIKRQNIKLIEKK
ncbi:MAG: hypothetical protein KAI43_05220 [Candidatus Aureabacteria bacterium]|nr:hypothetical protein [Candidatus Auribacterota bacterium]